MLFQRERAEIARLAAECGLDDGSPIASLETAGKNGYLLVLGTARHSGEAPADLASLRTVAHAKALRTASQFQRSEVSSEDSLRQVTTVRSSNGAGDAKSVEKTRTEVIRLRSQAIISNAYVVSSAFDAAGRVYSVVLAISLRPPSGG